MPMIEASLTRRQLLAGSLAAALTPTLARAAARPVTVGFIYVGPKNDYGWNQSHAVAAKKVAQLEGVKIIEQENVPETVEAEKVMEAMIRQDTAKVVFATSFGYWPSVLKVAPKYPDVLFTHIGALWKDGNPKNTIGYRGYMEEPHYLCGVAAGSELAPKGFLTGAEWNWAAGTRFVKAWQDGTSYPNLLRGGFKQDMVALSPFGRAVTPELRTKILAMKQGFVDDSLKLYKGPLKDNEGNVILKEGEVIANDDNKFKLAVNFLVEGAVGKTGLKK